MTIIAILAISSYVVKYGEYESELKRIQTHNEYIDDFVDNPGTEWKNWSNSWNQSGMTWKTLGENWYSVQSSWRSKGIDVSWDYVNDVANSLGGTTINYTTFSSRLFSRIMNDYKETEPYEPDNFLFIIGVAVGVFDVVLIIMFAIHLVVYEDISESINKLKRVRNYNKLATEYNENQLASDLRLHNEKLDIVRDYLKKEASNVRTHVAESYAEAKEYLKLTTAEIAVLMRQLRNSKYDFNSIRDFEPDDLEGVANLLDLGRADTFKEAMNLFIKESTENKHRQAMLEIEEARVEAEKEEIEKRLRAQEERDKQTRKHFEEMEMQAKVQSDLLKAQCDLAREQARRAERERRNALRKK